MSSSGYAHDRGEHDPGLAGAAAVLLGILVAVLGFFALMMWVDARHARNRCRPRSCLGHGLDARNRRARTRAPARSRAMHKQRQPMPTTSPPPPSRTRRRSGGTPAGTVADVDLQAHRPHGPDRARREVLGVGMGGWSPARSSTCARARWSR